MIYDHLVHPRLLRHARPDAERIDVGLAAPEPLEQEAICYLLAEKAREGKIVARLKWGDPFVFDRGGEEALFLHEHGVRFEVVPGIPAGDRRARLRRHPDHVSGRRRHGDVRPRARGRSTRRSRTSDWTSLAQARRHDRLLLRARKQLPGILERDAVARLVRRRTAAALIYDGTLPTQETIVGDDRRARRHGEAAEVQEPGDPRRRPRRPALREHLRWFDARPLFGKRILVTRPREQAAELVERARAAGRDVDRGADRSASSRRRTTGRSTRRARGVGQFDWIVFTSANGVDASSSGCWRGRRTCARSAASSCARSARRTAERLARHGLKVDLMPAEYRAEAVRRRRFARPATCRGQTVLLPRADIGREMLADELRKSGADVTEVIAYRTVAVGARARRRAGHLPDAPRPAGSTSSRSRARRTVRNFVQAARRRAGGRSAAHDRRSRRSAR